MPRAIWSGSLLFGLVILMNRLFPRFTLFGYWVGTNSGTTTIILFGTAVFSVLFLCVGIIGEYLVVILEEIKGRPAAVVDVVTGDLHLSPHAYGVLQAVPPKDPVA